MTAGWTLIWDLTQYTLKRVRVLLTALTGQAECEEQPDGRRRDQAGLTTVLEEKSQDQPDRPRTDESHDGNPGQIGQPHLARILSEDRQDRVSRQKKGMDAPAPDRRALAARPGTPSMIGGRFPTGATLLVMG